MVPAILPAGFVERRCRRVVNEQSSKAVLEPDEPVGLLVRVCLRRVHVRTNLRLCCGCRGVIPQRNTEHSNNNSNSTTGTTTSSRRASESAAGELGVDAERNRGSSL